ncbi:MAG: GNAT family N-acetyltransferase [Acidimicrobiales bacterium]
MHGSRVVLRPVTDADLDDLCVLFAEPEVARWWGNFDRDRIVQDIIHDDDEGISTYTILVGGAVVGLIQSWEEPDPEYRRANVDIALSTRWHGTGVAVDAIRTVARHLIDDKGHHHLTIDPAAGNARAIACYRKLGFQPVGILRNNERGADGTFHDTLLMDLLAGELVE